MNPGPEWPYLGGTGHLQTNERVSADRSGWGLHRSERRVCSLQDWASRQLLCHVPRTTVFLTWFADTSVNAMVLRGGRCYNRLGMGNSGSLAGYGTMFSLHGPLYFDRANLRPRLYRVTAPPVAIHFNYLLSLLACSLKCRALSVHG